MENGLVPNKLPEEAIREYQEAYKKVKGKTISYEEALTQTKELFTLFKAIYKPIKKEWANEYDKKRALE